MTSEKKWFILGSSGQLGRALCSELQKQASAPDVFIPTNLNINDHKKTLEVISEIKPNVIVNCAAWTNVLQAEVQENEANQVNGWAVKNIGFAAKENNSLLVHMSTDYVFSGESTSPYSEEDLPSPVNAYGRSKALGENLLMENEDINVYLLRTAWLYGAHRKNFLKTILLNQLSSEAQIDIVNDQFGNPTSARDVARRIIEISVGEFPNGKYHAVNTGSTSWFGLAEHAFSILGIDIGILNPIQTPISQKIKRPTNSTLDSSKWTLVGSTQMRPWQDALNAEIHKIYEQVIREKSNGV